MNVSENIKGPDDGWCPRKKKKVFAQAGEVNLSSAVELRCAVHGFTQNLSQEGVMMEGQPLPSRQQSMAPRTGDMGFLVLQYHNLGAPGSMKICCRVVHTQANRIGMHLFYSKMSTLDKKHLDMILEMESGNI